MSGLAVRAPMFGAAFLFYSAAGMALAAHGAETPKPVAGKQNDPMMPIAWIKSYKTPSGQVARVFTTTMGASQDLSSEGLRRLLVNACYWALKMDDQIPAKSNVEIVGVYEPTPFGHNAYKKGVKPEDLK